MDYKELWIQIIKDLDPIIKRTNILAWFNNTAIIDQTENEITVGLPLPMYLDWHQKHLKVNTLQVVKKMLPKIDCIKYVVDLALDRDEDPRGVKIIEIFPSKKRERKLPNKNEIKLPGGIVSKILNKRYQLSNFVIGNNNRLAHAACLSVASKPGVNYNPLFVYGGVGLGKTHLLQGLGNEVKKNYPNKIVVYLTSEDFTNEVVLAIQKRSTEKLREKYRKADLLIIDDIQFIANKDRTQEEFFHTFNALYQAGKQIVISSDRPPIELDILEDRLRSRFSMGMIADISEPDYETRLAILHTKLHYTGIILSNEVLEFIAYNIKGNVRELEGAMNQVVAVYDLENITPTIKSVTKILKNMIKNTENIGFIEDKKEMVYIKTFDDLIDIVCEYFNVPKSEVLGVSRIREYTLPRQVSMYLGKKKMKMALTRIAEKFSRDHTSVLHAVRKIEKELRNNRQIIRDVNAIKEEAGLM